MPCTDEHLIIYCISIILFYPEKGEPFVHLLCDSNATPGGGKLHVALVFG